jgi:hypothetical protein
MKIVSLIVAVLLVYLPITWGQAKILTSDPVTGLPLLPPTDSIKKVGNDPVKMPDGMVCKSKMQGDFYKLYDYFVKDNINYSDALAWYTAHLAGFKKIESSNHSRTIFYKPDGTMVVIVTAGSPTPGGLTKTSSVAYERYQPGISEKTIASMTQQKITCN